MKELKGTLNSQAAEQLHRSCNKDKHFSHKMTPSNHICLFRSVKELRNEAKNIKIMNKMKVQTKTRAGLPL